MRRCTVLVIAFSALASIFQTNAVAQFTSPSGNYDVFVRKSSSSQFGLLKSTIFLPSNLGTSGTDLTEKGILYSRQYPLGAFDPIVLSMNDQIEFALEGFFRIGGGLGSGSLGEPWGPFTSPTVKYYVVLLDLFSVDIAPSYTHLFRNGTGLTAKCGVTIVNIGATAAILDKGMFRDSGILVANILPVQITGSLLFDFGRSALGFSVLVNTSSVLNFTRTPEALYGDEYRGLISTTLIKKFAFQIVYEN